MPTKLQVHIDRWSSCTACRLCHTRRNVVLLRGDVPSDVTFIGEGPGKAEDDLASPFEGPAGQLLDDIVERSIGRFHKGLYVSFTNLIGCIPWEDEERQVKTKAPPHYAVMACQPRLEEFLAIAKPRLIVCVGREAEDYIQIPRYRDSARLPKETVKVIEITHPSHMLQQLTPAHRHLAVLRAAAQITQALDKVFGSCDE